MGPASQPPGWARAIPASAVGATTRPALRRSRRRSWCDGLIIRLRRGWPHTLSMRCLLWFKNVAIQALADAQESWRWKR